MEPSEVPAEDRFEAERPVRFTPDAWMQGFLRWGAFAVLGLLGLASFRLGDHNVAYMPLVLLAVLSLGASRLRRVGASSFRRMAVVATPAGLWAGDEWVADAELESALVQFDASGVPAVCIRRKHATSIVVQVTDVQEGRRLVGALGLDASRRMVEMPGPSWLLVRYPWAASVVGLLVAATFALHVDHAMQVAGWMVLACYMFLVLRRSQVTVGADGVLMRWMGYRRFIAFASMHGIEVLERRNRRVARVTLRSGETMDFPLSTRRGIAEGATLVERIEEGLIGARARAGAPLPYLPSRADKPLRQWLDELRGFGMGATTHRTAAVDPEALARMVESAEVGPDQRAAAAVALAASEGGVPRLRVAAEAVAEPKLRVAIDAAAGGDDAALEEALAELELESRAARS